MNLLNQYLKVHILRMHVLICAKNLSKLSKKGCFNKNWNKFVKNLILILLNSKTRS